MNATTFFSSVDVLCTHTLPRLDLLREQKQDRPSAKTYGPDKSTLPVATSSKLVRDVEGSYVRMWDRVLLLTPQACIKLPRVLHGLAVSMSERKTYEICHVRMVGE